MEQITLAYNYFPSEDIRYKLALEAIESLSNHCSILAIGTKNDLKNCPGFFIKTDPIIRNATTVFNYTRPLPFVRDVFNKAYKFSSPSSFLIYLNSDIILDPVLVDTVIKILDQGYETFTASAVQIHPVRSISAIKSSPVVYLKGMSKGYDVFGFKRDLFPELDAFMPDFLIGEHKWDLMFKDMLEKTTKNIYLDGDPFYHIIHNKIWHNKNFGFHYNDFLYDPETFTKRCKNFKKIGIRSRLYQK